ncbi:MAG: efflux transporter outer membrane subunit [Synoicihabitans sp.]
MNAALIRIIPVLTLAGCTVGPDYTAPHLTEVTSFAAAPAPETSEAFPLDWWATIDDPTLHQLLKTASRQNLDIAIARARLREARAGVRATASANQPRFGTGGSASRQRQSDNSPTLPPLPPGTPFPLETDVFRAGFDASWELDVFGGNRRANEAAEARLEATTANAAEVMHSLLAEVALNYIELRSLQQRADNVRRSIALQAKTVTLVESLREAGLATDLEVSQARAQWLLTQASLPGLRSSIDQRGFQIDVLLGRAPDTHADLWSQSGQFPEMPVDTLLRLPADVLRHRPDVRTVERRLAAETAEIGQARADLLPKFSLNGGFGVESGSTGNLFTSASRNWTLGPGVQWALFEGGRIRANIEAQSAQTDAARATYEQVVLRALQEVDTAWVALQQEGQTELHLAASRAELENALKLANSLYREGLSPLRDVLEAEARLIVTKNQHVESVSRQWSNLIRLYKAMGGGPTPTTS